MRRVAIVGSGQGGLQLGFGLLKYGYQVTLFSDRTADQWLNHSRPNGTAFLFGRAVQYERDLSRQLRHGSGICSFSAVHTLTGACPRAATINMSSVPVFTI